MLGLLTLGPSYNLGAASSVPRTVERASPPTMQGPPVKKLTYGDDARNAQLVRLFGVDAIPHIALISPTAPKGRQLQAVLVGDVPEPVLDADLRALADGEPPPWGRIAAPGPNE